MIRLLLLTSALALTACAPVSSAGDLPQGKCSTTGLDRFVGRPATPALVAKAKRAAGADIARILRPGQMVTMEYREGRLNVRVDDANKVTGFTCG